jgi:hypothetical protein
MLVIAIVAAFLSVFPRAMPITVIVVVGFPDELSNGKRY